jgi:dipeptidyl aminopeptidase/acylaminoacyl peptidase
MNPEQEPGTRNSEPRTAPAIFTPAAVASQTLRLGSVVLEGDTAYWLEGRPAEGGRNVIVRCSADGRLEDVTPAGFNVRTRVHEYGGGAFAIDRGTIFFSNFADQRLYRLDAGAAAPVPITAPGGCFYANLIVDRRRGRLIGVREDHRASGEPVTTLVSVPMMPDSPDHGTVLVSGHDFFSSPQLSPDGSRLAWLSWDHPRMPWDGTELWVADVDAEGRPGAQMLVAGGPAESIYQPGWIGPDVLQFASDRDGWWQLYRADLGAMVDDAPRVDRLIRNPPQQSEFGRPAWTFATQTWAMIDPARVLVSYGSRGHWHLALFDTVSGTLSPIAADLQPHEWLATNGTHALLVASSAVSPAAVVRIDLASGGRKTLRSTMAASIDPAVISVPEAIEFPTTGGVSAHAFYYPPSGTLDGSRRPPPLIAISHGGPTTASMGTFDLRIQFWTSRGFAVVDVNYGGSTGYGRSYRERLNARWGIVDVDDMVAAVRYLAAQGKADPDRLVIRGGSAGGYTTLAALTSHPEVFRAGASYYGVSDVEVLARDTHKFESRYLDTLIGPYPQMRELYRERSPITHVDRLSCALILFQGLEDKVVPPNQSEMMADAVRRKGLPVVYLTFEGEQHGFRRAETVVRCLEAELSFYAEVFGAGARWWGGGGFC